MPKHPTEPRGEAARAAPEGRDRPDRGEAASRKVDYHHGNLKNALLAAAMESVAKASHESLRLRELAAAAGVSPPAVYKHFRGREDLLEAVSLRGFELLAEATRSAIARRHGRERLIAAGLAYVEFGLANRSLFKLMFSAAGKAGRERAKRNARRDPSASALELLRAEIRSFTKREDVELDSLQAWALVHGLVEMIGTEIIVPPVSPEAVVRCFVSRLDAGLAEGSGTRNDAGRRGRPKP